MLLGLTGSIGSGKSFIAGILEHLDIPVYYSDIRAKELMIKPGIKEQIINLLGDDAYWSDGNLNRKYVAEKIFSDMDLKKALESIVHSAVKKDFDLWVQEHAGSRLLVKESALLIESGTYKDMDYVVVVTAPEAVRIRRVVERDGLSEEEVRQRIRHQMPDEERIRFADFVLENSGNRLILPQITEIFQKIAYHVV